MPVTGPEAPASWAEHLRATMVLALPLIGAAAGADDHGRHRHGDARLARGARSWRASVLGTQAIFLLYIFGVGFAQAVMPLAAAAEGAGDAAGAAAGGAHGALGAGALQRAGACCRSGTPSASCWRSGRSRRSPALAGALRARGQWSMLPALVITGIRAFLTVVGHAYVLLAVIVAGAVVNGVLNYALIFGHFGFPAIGVRRLGAGDHDRQPR